MSMALDDLDRLAAPVFDGYIVRKDLVRKYSRQYPVPTYVVEFLLGRYCASVNESEIAEGLQIVEKQLKDRTVRTGEEELFKARARETGSIKIIDIVRARLDAKNDCYVAELPSLTLRDVRIEDQLVRDNERLLTDGFYAEVTLTYDGIIAQEKGGRPFKIDALRPIQMSKSDVLDVYAKARGSFSTAQWIDFLLRSIGLEPGAFSERAKLVALLRMIPFVERNYNLVELGPRGTGKSMHAQVRRVLRQAWEMDDAAKAETLLRNLARRLEKDWEGVSASILEGLDEMLTVTRLGLPADLRRSLACTNIVENVMGTVRRVCRNVKYWRSPSMALRWVGAAMQEAAKGFRRLKAHKQLPLLKAALAARKANAAPSNEHLAQTAKAA